MDNIPAESSDIMKEIVSDAVNKATDLFSWLKANNREADIIQAIDDPDHLAKLFDAFEQFKRK